MRKRFWFLVLGLLLSSFVHAEPEFLSTFGAHYGAGLGPLRTAKCLTCHVEPPVRNPYGKAVEAAMQKEGLTKLTAAVLQAIEGQDSDGDGWTNIDEIKQGFLPGDSKSHPTGASPNAAGVPPSEPAAAAPLIPLHSFHPLIVHFPIALFLFGAFIDVLGSRRKDDGLRRFALWNIGFGAIASLGAVVSGPIAFLRMGFPWSGIPLYHLILGVLASVFMIAAAFTKRKNPLAAGPYWIVIALATLCTAVAGHLGSMIVFG